MTVSTGVGAGAVLDGHLVHGRRSGAELGHTILDLSAHRDGLPATVEHLGSGTALARAAGDAGLHLDGAALVEQVRAGDPTARAVWDGVVAAVVASAVNLAHLFTPGVIVVTATLGDDAGLVGAAAWPAAPGDTLRPPGLRTGPARCPRPARRSASRGSIPPRRRAPCPIGRISAIIRVPGCSGRTER